MDIIRRTFAKEMKSEMIQVIFCFRLAIRSVKSLLINSMMISDLSRVSFRLELVLVSRSNKARCGDIW